MCCCWSEATVVRVGHCAVQNDRYWARMGGLWTSSGPGESDGPEWGSLLGQVCVLVVMGLRMMVLIVLALTGIAQLVFLVVLKHSVLMSCCQALAWMFLEDMGWPA